MLPIRHRTGQAVVLVSLTVLILAGSVLAGRPGNCLAGWVNSRRFPPFDVWSEFPLEESEDLLAELTQLQVALQRDLGLPRPRQWLGIYLFRSQHSYAGYLKQNLPNVPYRRALYVQSQGQGRVYAYRSRELPTDLRHECTHALLHAVLPVVPLWLDEGLAEYYEVPAEKRSFDNPHLGMLRWNIMFHTVPPLKSLEKKGDFSEMNGSDYRYAWAWVHFMLHGPPEAKEELVAFLHDIWAAVPPGFLSQRLRHRLPGTEQRLVKHFKNWKRGGWFGGFR